MVLFIGFNQVEGLGVLPYVDLLISNLIEKDEDGFKNALNLIKILLKYTKPEHLAPHIKKITGALIRVCNYKLQDESKIEIL